MWSGSMSLDYGQVHLAIDPAVLCGLFTLASGIIQRWRK